MTTATYTIEGLTCPACMAKVMEGVRLIPQVTTVAVDLVRNGPSSLFIRSKATLAPQVVRESVEHAGLGFRVSGEQAPQPKSFGSLHRTTAGSRRSRVRLITKASDPAS